MIFERWWWFRTFFPPSDSGSMVIALYIESQIYLFERLFSTFIYTRSFMHVHNIRLWSAIWISSPVFVVTFFCPFFIIFHSSQRQSTLLPVKWPCIFLMHLICLHFFVYVCFCYGFNSFPALFHTFPSIHLSIRFIRTWSKNVDSTLLALVCILHFSIVQLFISVAWFWPCNFICQADYYYMQCSNKFIDYFFTAFYFVLWQWT